jgi:protein-ribulosamine 3-kinase
LVANLIGRVLQSQTNSRDQYSGEFAGMKALHDVVPELTPVPIAHGTYSSDPSVYFFLCNFHDMTDDIPDMQKFTAKLAELHMKGISPNGKYGFHVPVFFGRWPQETAWTESWEVFFRNYMKRALALEEQSQGPDAELKTLSESLFSKVIPRLLRPLETGGRQIQPRLVHGNLWDGNTSTDIETGLPVIYDACSIYAHSECKFHLMGIRTILRRQMSLDHGGLHVIRSANHMSRPTTGTSQFPPQRKTLRTATLCMACKSLRLDCGSDKHIP